MSKSTTMLRTRRRDNNVKPNRRDTRLTRLDRKSSRGMIYENEELRLRTININAEIERGQYDIKKLKRENEMLKKEIWCLRDEYEKLDKLLKEKEIDFSSSSTTCSTSDSESCSSCTEESEEVETSQNLENVQKTNMKNLHASFDHLSVVPEETSTGDNSDKTSNRTSLPNDQWTNDTNIIKPDQSYPQIYGKSSTLPVTTPPKNFFSPIKISKSYDDSIPPNQFYHHDPPETNNYQILVPEEEKTSTDLIVKTDNHNFTNGTPSRSTFSNGGNLEELLNDIETISQDILQITNDQKAWVKEEEAVAKPYKSELNVVLMPNPMPLIGFDKYREIQKSFESLHSKSAEKLAETSPQIEPNPFFFGNLNDPAFDARYNPERFDDKPPLGGSKTNLLEPTSSEQISSENEENLKFKTSQPDQKSESGELKQPKLSIRRKVSIHFKGKKDKKAAEKKHNSLFDIKFGSSSEKTPKTPLESKKSMEAEPKTPTSSESKASEKKKSEDKKQRKSVSISPDRKHVHDKKHKKHKKGDRGKTRRGTITSVDRLNRERSFSVCTDRSNDHRLGGLFYDEYGLQSERERTNSMSSCETVKTRKMSNISNIPLNGKVPWCACWGNGCI